ncbi:MAG: leucine-rich repeat domain-containing protein, partial [Bacteroidaceae bacterium]|nr:leucine-rich repeat domain-containing protein [Bacteroidaceae bacterium]
IPMSITKIKEGVFEDCKGLTGITISNNVTSIGDFAFKGCCSLENIDLPDSVIYIGDWTFFGCWKLHTIKIPNSVINIGMEAFADCVNLKSLHIQINEPEKCIINETAFAGINLEDCILYVPAGTRWSYRHHPAFCQFKNIEIER